MADKDIDPVKVIKEEFPDGELREHLEYLKTAYLKYQKRQKMLGSVADKVITGVSMAILIFIGNAVLTEAKRWLAR